MSQKTLRSSYDNKCIVQEITNLIRNDEHYYERMQKFTLCIERQEWDNIIALAEKVKREKTAEFIETIAKISPILKENPNIIDEHDWDGETPLERAIIAENIHMIDWVLQQNAQVEKEHVAKAVAHAHIEALDVLRDKVGHDEFNKFESFSLYDTPQEHFKDIKNWFKTKTTIVLEDDEEKIYR